MPSLPLTPEEERQILQTVGAQSVEDLFSSIPPKIRENADFKFGSSDEGRGLTEHELRKEFAKIAAKNASDFSHFLGGGVYDNILPALIEPLMSRGEFLTCYTPYQPEVSQGTLQVIFEFQTMISRLAGLEAANASMYDGANAAAEAVLMAQRVTRKPNGAVLMADSLHPEYVGVTKTYQQCHAKAPIGIPYNPTDGLIDVNALKALIAEHDPAAVVVGWPNYFGAIEKIDEIRAVVPDTCLLVAAVADPSAFALFEPPGQLGADIVAGEAHQLGTPMLFGGPHVGFFATKKKHIRQMPGRLVGETVDGRGNRAYALTLATREQHIRREKATSNICTNQGLIALRTTIYLSFIGKRGFEYLGETNFSRFEYLRSELEARGIPLRFKDGLHYREGVFEVPRLEHRFEKALAQKIVPGIRLAHKFPDQAEAFANSLLITAHPKHTKAELDQLVEALTHD